MGQCEWTACGLPAPATRYQELGALYLALAQSFRVCVSVRRLCTLKAPRVAPTSNERAPCMCGKPLVDA